MSASDSDSDISSTSSKTSLEGHRQRSLSQCSSDIEDEVCCLRMKKVDDRPWASTLDVINFQVSQNVELTSVLVFRPFEGVGGPERYKVQVYHTSTGQITLEQEVESLLEVDCPQVGEIKIESPPRIDSHRTYTAVLETGTTPSFGGEGGRSVVFCPVPKSRRSLVVSFSNPRRDDLGKRDRTVLSNRVFT